jgi:ferritin
MLTLSKPEAAARLFAQAQEDAERRRKFYQFMHSRNLKTENAPATLPVQSVGQIEGIKSDMV